VVPLSHPGLSTFLVQSESLSGRWAKLHPVAAVAASNNRDHSFFACSLDIYMGAMLSAHPVHGESHIQRKANREVATLSYPDEYSRKIL